ncbi:MAG: PorP/SprF family type IX secretion system membrane protein [bacterium]
MNNKFLYITLIILLGLARSGISQDPQFSQFYSSPLYMGPSFAGLGDGGRVIINYRDQWPKISGTYITYAISGDYYIDRYKSGIGFLILRDDAGNGLFNITNLGLNYSYNFNINPEWQIRPGLQAYYYMKEIHYDRLKFGDEILRGTGTGSSMEMSRLQLAEPTRHFDFTGSVLAYSESLWLGVTVDHLMYFSEILAREGDYMPVRLSVYGGGKYNISGRTRKRYEENITGAFNLLIQDKYRYLDLGTYYTKEPLVFGLWYRGVNIFPDNPNTGALALLLGLKFDSISVGYSYDFTTSSLITRTGGAHEVSLIYTFDDKRRKKTRHKALPCPSF